jgi:hypothetical protein
MSMNATSVNNKSISGEDGASPTNHKALPQLINNTFADSNYGLQAAVITGHVNAEFHHHAPGTVRPSSYAAVTWKLTKNLTLELPEAPPNPLSTVPFRRDPDYVQRGPLFEEISLKLSQPAARVALVGLGGVG